MPIQIKPTHHLGSCVLTLDSIKGIIHLVKADFRLAEYSANDGVWEIVDEPEGPFLAAISQHDTLDSFCVRARTEHDDERITLDIVFDEREAKVVCIARPEDQHWFEHFLFDLKKLLLPPTFKQIMVHKLRGGEIYFKPAIMGFVTGFSGTISTPYTKIVIRDKPPNAFLENVKANLVSNVIWAILVFILGIIATFVGQWLFRRGS